MGQYTRWQVGTSEPLPKELLDPERLHDSRDGALMAAFRAALKLLRKEPPQKDMAAFAGFVKTFEHSNTATHAGITWKLRKVEPVYFREVEDKERDERGEPGAG